MTVYDVCIIGGGASGLIAAISAKRARQDISILVIEKNDRVGKKLINTGNGRCWEGLGAGGKGDNRG